MNTIDDILLHPFCERSLEEKLEIKRLGPHQPTDILIVKGNRKFSSDWYRKYKWLTVSVQKEKLFCFYCALLGGEIVWSVTGFDDIKHLSEALKRHESSNSHTTCAVRFKTLGSSSISAHLDKARNKQIDKHNEQVPRNRYILKKIIECMIFCGSNELSLRDHDESATPSKKGVLLNLFNFVSKFDSDLALGQHLNNATVAKYTSKTSQNELLDSIFSVYLDDLQKEIIDADFVSVQADETADVASESQFVIALRFSKGSSVSERFLSFVKVSDRTTDGLSSVLNEYLEPFQLKEKLVAQAYDGASVTSGQNSGIHKLIKQTYPHAHFVHSYAHQLNLILQQACSAQNKDIDLFFTNLSAFPAFFSVSPKRTDLLSQICNKRLSKPSQTRWCFQNRCLRSVQELKSELIECFEQMQTNKEWDNITSREAAGLNNLLKDSKFIFFLDLFNVLFQHVDIFYNLLQKRSSTSEDVTKHLQRFETAIQEVRDDIDSKLQHILQNVNEGEPSTKRRRMDLKQLLQVASNKACDSLLFSVRERFERYELVLAFSVIDPKNFTTFKAQKPSGLIALLTKYYPFLYERKLMVELDTIYATEALAELRGIKSFLEEIVKLDLEENLPETTKLCRIVLATPVSTDESEHIFSILKRIKTCHRNTMGEEKLNALTVLSVHADLFTAEFIDKAIDRFATSKEIQTDLLYMTK
ncbi:hypothetical protein PoB_004770600 [Plakobranchus ocellatus]|uniref:TTF-type domain-containing protein n=1 Tax=Plakobranchus ocellatus TaxID=259542 RepID=A0AAV4BLB2_9GAST|nr:hypothetical protein PoB_004770600 [Plakobranchus ocellatus]